MIQHENSMKTIINSMIAFNMKNTINGMEVFGFVTVRNQYGSVKYDVFGFVTVRSGDYLDMVCVFGSILIRKKLLF